MPQVKFKDKDMPERFVPGLGLVNGQEWLDKDDEQLDAIDAASLKTLGIEVKKTTAKKEETE